MAGIEFQQSSTNPENNMEEHDIPSSAVNYDYDLSSANLEHNDRVNKLRGSPSKALWQGTRRRRISFYSPDDTAFHSDSSSMSSKYNSDSDFNLSTRCQSPATSWSSHCDETSDHETSQHDDADKLKEKHTSPRRASGEKPLLKLSIDTQNLPPWDAWFPDWEQCLSPEPIRKLGAGWSDIQASHMQGLWTPPPPRREAGGLWGN
ncbi:hypothetical protein VP1G_04032 [Cytospora mali]|uniref:Uncharacterized protein n=1 Tax=Cytospora mali TaxID=578113 RepID=A0A194UYM2_CYTMA|nr:hypothetical protein VP1G_04032 [Valsa mali var. pyri (nom. inval.)]